MKKVISILAAVMLIAASLSACTSGGAPAASGGDSLKVVTTIFPEYDWVMNILGDTAKDTEVTMLLDSGVDLHSYQPTAKDILTIAGCDVFIYVGGESDEWVEDALQEATNKDMVVVNLLEALGDAVKEEEVVEGMQEEDHDHHHEEGEEHDHEEGEEHDHDHEEGPEYDEHVWLSLRNAASLAATLADALSQADPGNAETYRANAESYAEKLSALDKEYEKAVSEASFSTVLFGDRFPFRYLTDDYGLSYYAAFVGCSAETEASFETITFLADKVDELSLPAVLTIEGTDHRIAETIVQNTKAKDQQILTMDSMQSVTAKDVQAGAEYLSIMEDNLAVLRDALK